MRKISAANQQQEILLNGKVRNNVRNRGKRRMSMPKSSPLPYLYLMQAERLFAGALAGMALRPADTIEYTCKVFSQTLSRRILDALNLVLGKRLRERGAADMSKLTRLFHAMQRAYELAVIKPKGLSNWREAITARMKTMAACWCTVRECVGRRRCRGKRRPSLSRQWGATNW